MISNFFRNTFLFICLFVTSVVSVVAAPISDEILDGTPTDANDYAYVARLEYDGDMFCTGTVVGSRYILTAAHCFYENNQRWDVGDTFSVRLGSTVYQSAKVQIHSTYKPGDSACIEGQVDAAVVTLTSDVTNAPIIPMLSTSVPKGGTVFLAGFGTQGTGAGGEDGTTPPVGIINVGYATVDGFGSNAPSQNLNSIYFFWKFRSGYANTGSGDSGGPAFYDVGGQRFLGGITCGGEGNAGHGTYSYDTRIDVIKSWVESAMGQGGGGGGTTPSTLKIAGAELLYTGNRSKDYLYVRGTVNVGKNFKPKGKSVKVTIGNYSRNFKLSAKGESIGGGYNYFDLTGTLKKSTFTKSTLKFEIEMDAAALFKHLATVGFPVNKNATKGQQVSLPLTVTVNGITSSGSRPLKYRGKVWK